MERRRFLALAAVCAVAPSLACARTESAGERDEIVITVHKDPG